MSFERLSEDVAGKQNIQAKSWKDENLLNKILEEKKNAPLFMFYEGPPTANGKPGIHHIIARTLKDSICRHKTMQGFKVPRKAGWDTHGLPVEIEVEKELKLYTKKDIENYGIDKFNEKCRKSVFKYESMWRDMTEKMGYLIDMDNPYITLDDDYIESVWWILKRFFDEKLIYEGHKIMPYCPRCGTGLASHEVAQGYKEVKTNTVTVLFKRKDKDEYFLAWTTTPWTLFSNIALTVGPDISYLKVRLKNVKELNSEKVDERVKLHGGKILYIAKNLAKKVLGDDNFEIIEEFKGRDLEGIEYEQLLPYIDVHKFGTRKNKAFILTTADYATDNDGTGIVHTAPAFGEDDYNTGLRYNLPVVNPVDEEGKFIDGPHKGHFVLEEGLDVEIIKDLAKRNLLFAKEKFTHNYPFCWRCNTPLIYYAKKGWYIKMTSLKDRLIENNDTVNWFPKFIGEKRFANWLENLNDWAISRTRYWGTPIPIWRCEKCGELKCIGSKEELLGGKNEMKVELHKPYVDEIEFTCSCGGLMKRISEVLDCWFDSGAMPFAQMHYPFENEKNFDRDFFPADFICEGIDQTRGWFYSLLAISTFVKNKSPYKNVLVNDLILDKDGKKMSKTKGNTADPFTLFEKYGADAVRFYLLYTSPAWSPTRFDEDGVKEISSKFFGTLRNIYQFFILYANIDGIDKKFIDENKKKIGSTNNIENELDKFILSKYHSLIKAYIKALDKYDHMNAVKLIFEFVNENFSNWYIRRSRRRFWAAEMTSDKKFVFLITYEILVGLAKLFSPIAPFLSDEIYVNLTKKEGVHLSAYPEYDEDFIDNEITEKMDIAKKISNLGRAIREKENIKVRQPLSKIILPSDIKDKIKSLEKIIKDEINIKEIEYVKDKGNYVNHILSPNFKIAGKALGQKMRDFKDILSSLNSSDLLKDFEEKGESFINIKGDEVLIEKDFVEIKVDSKKGFSSEIDGDLFAILDTKITSELRDEGFVREFISKVQQLRKKADLEMMDSINIHAVISDDILRTALIENKDYILKETIGKELIFSTEKIEEFDINGINAGIKIDSRNV
ncbi:MAG: isoleucine--tRNA ligase [Clostridiales Family XIII bacterium]|jgi:isoleucyl-tRNA synthetase|nr:isoleucine--tRNA ligase [Clostridiales Family XIII bacterium]